MPRYRSKSTVEAVQWNGDPYTVKVAIKEPTGHTPGGTLPASRYYVLMGDGQRVYLEVGDWIITESRYPCVLSDAAFQAEYEPAG